MLTADDSAFALLATLNVPVIHKSMEELRMVTQSEIERERYEARMKAQRDAASRLSAAREDGIDEGIAKGGFMGAIRVYQEILGEPLTPVEELRGLSVEELRQLAQNWKEERAARGATE